MVIASAMTWRIIAEAIAMYWYNDKRQQTRGLPTLGAMTVPCITIVGTCPTFYLVLITQALSIAVQVVTGQFPETPTKVVKSVTFLGNLPFSVFSCPKVLPRNIPIPRLSHVRCFDLVASALL